MKKKKCNSKKKQTTGIIQSPTHSKLFIGLLFVIVEASFESFDVIASVRKRKYKFWNKEIHVMCSLLRSINC